MRDVIVLRLKSVLYILRVKIDYDIQARLYFNADERIIHIFLGITLHVHSTFVLLSTNGCIYNTKMI